MERVIFHLGDAGGLELLWVTNDPAVLRGVVANLLRGISAGVCRPDVSRGCRRLLPLGSFCPGGRPVLAIRPDDFLRVRAGQNPLPVVILPACESLKPGLDWVCFNGGWVPLGHPLVEGQIHRFRRRFNQHRRRHRRSRRQADAPRRDPFLGIPGLFSGVCVNGGWVPVGHPLAGGGG